MNPKQMQALMKQMGIKSRPIDATEVIIRGNSGEITISNPQVMEVEMQGVKTYQVTGQVSAHTTGKTSNEDVKLVAEKAGCSEEEARKALEESGGDIAAAIVKLRENS